MTGVGLKVDGLVAGYGETVVLEPDSTLLCRANSMVCSRFLCSTEQGNVFQRTGNFRARSENSAA
jgi:hypothetical protein